ncbi:QsdR family transcriptional regulator [Pseudonocardia sp. GCM10023141]|uniref:QsdR family transcriptional regulator n=1 Tax=Pseudonocardia sp. GCM10023141 TaxID=3252653 RepID=UPI0036130E36
MTETATPLQRQLAGTTTGRPTALDAFVRARRAFQAGERLDMQALAADLGVNRATLYRWVGSRELLLREVIWSLTQRTIQRGLDRQRHQDGPRLAAVLGGFVRDVHTHPGMHRFITDEGEAALRLLTMQAGGYQQRLIGLVHDLITEHTAAGELCSPVPVDDLAYTVVRVIESYVYLKVITGEEPDPDRAGRVLHALLPAPAEPAG